MGDINDGLPAPITGRIFVNTDELPWAPVPGTPGQWFKLLRIDERTGGLTMLLKIEPGTWTPPHEHFGPVEFFTLQGKWAEDEIEGGLRAGGYAFEPTSYAHQEAPPDNEIIMFGRSEGNVQSYDGDGEKFPELGYQMMVEVWKRHLERVGKSAAGG